MAFVIYKWTFSESLSPPFADAAYLPTFEMIIGFELAWIENCTRWKAVLTVSYAFFTRAFCNAAGGRERAEIAEGRFPYPLWLLSDISFSLNSGSAGSRRRRWQRMVSARAKK
jgi:hypothetical protein